jgi:hypothetical protein
LKVHNLNYATDGGSGAWSVSGVNITVRDNVFKNASGSSGPQVAQRGIEPAPQYVEVYNKHLLRRRIGPARGFPSGWQ